MSPIEKLKQNLRSKQGRLSQLSNILGLLPSTVTKWKNVPPAYADRVEAFTGIPKHELCPDVYKNPGKLMSWEDIESKKSPEGFWSEDALTAWGVPWPPPKGWKEELIRNGAPYSPSGGAIRTSLGCTRS